MKSINYIAEIKDWLETDDEMCEEITSKKYLYDDGNTKESIKDMLKRVTEMKDESPKYQKEIKDLIASGIFVPAGRILSGRGIPEKYGVRLTYSNCAVEPAPEDNLESIYDAIKHMGRIFSYGGGVGVDISKLAPRGAKINNTAKNSTGAVSFCNLLSCNAETISQNQRRGALMISLDGSHPDLEEFITCKANTDKITGANISIKFNNDFFKYVKNNLMWTTKFYRPESDENILKMYNAKYILHKIAVNNYDYGEPGILYWDRVNNYSLLSGHTDFKYSTTNPCGELPLPDGGTCLLGSINLSKIFTSNVSHEFRDQLNNFDIYVQRCIRYLDAVQDEGIDYLPLDHQKEVATKYRAIGLGIMGLSDMLINLGYRYGSAESLIVCDQIGYHMAWYTISESNQLAKEYGMYNVCEPDKIIESDFFKYNVNYNPFFSKIQKKELIENVKKYGLRNGQLLSIAPTGTISTIFNVSNGVEPIFSMHYTRTTKSIYKNGDKTYDVYPECVKRYFKQKGKEINLEELPDYFVCSSDITWKERIDMQSVWQTHIDNAISGTVNLPESATVEDIENLFMYAYEKGLKGITVFRSKCKRVAILNDNSKNNKKEDEDIDAKSISEKDNNIVKENPYKAITRKELGKRLESRTYYSKIACGHNYITVSRDENDNPVEVFVNPSKSGGCAANADCLGRYASDMLRRGIPIEEIVDITKGVKCPACASLKGKGEKLDGLSCGDAMARILEQEDKLLKKKKEINNNINNDDTNTHDYEDKKDIENDYKRYSYDENLERGICPECGSKLNTSEGCPKCINCGFSRC